MVDNSLQEAYLRAEKELTKLRVELVAAYAVIRDLNDTIAWMSEALGETPVPQPSPGGPGPAMPELPEHERRDELVENPVGNVPKEVKEKVEQIKDKVENSGKKLDDLFKEEEVVYDDSFKPPIDLPHDPISAPLEPEQ